jgi:hypothetical protein
MGAITRTIEMPNLHMYEPEYNENGTERHIVCDGARFHVLWWDARGQHCSEPNCEVNARLMPNS